MKIFVTGGAGFIGGNFVLKQVLQDGNKVLNFDKNCIQLEIDSKIRIICTDSYNKYNKKNNE